MASFFNKTSTPNVEVNKRTILADIELGDGAYEGKKVSRAEMLAQQEDDSEDDEEDVGESGEEDMIDGDDE